MQVNHPDADHHPTPSKLIASTLVGGPQDMFAIPGDRTPPTVYYPRDNLWATPWGFNK